MRKLISFFDKLEDRTRGMLSRYPIIYAFLAGVGTVWFWRGVWHISDDLGITSTGSLLLGFFVLISTGVLVTEFIGSRIIISGLRGEKKLEEKTLQDIEEEEMFLVDLKKRMVKIEKMLEEIKNKS